MMTVMSISDIQARIQAIEAKFVTPSSNGTAGGASSTANFADLLSAASELGQVSSTTGDGTSSGTGAGTDWTSLLGSLGGTSPTTLPSYDKTAGGATGRNAVFLQNALAQTGDPYVWGSSASPTDPNPSAFDCSELVKWAAKRAGVDMPDGSWLQYLQLKQQGATIPVQQALQTPGALLFSFSSEPTPGGGRPSRAHVAISLGNGKTIEARGKAYGVGSFDAGNRFQYAAIVPGLTNA
jgi:cell wall-associated NlpC family hydrolase